DRNDLPPPPDLPAVEPLPDWLCKLWGMHDQWQAVGVYRRAPRAFQQFEALLPRAEERWRSGIEVDRLQDELGQDLFRVKRQADAAVDLTKRPARSLAAARGPDRKADPGAVQALRVLLEKAAPDA